LPLLEVVRNLDLALSLSSSVILGRLFSKRSRKEDIPLLDVLVVGLVSLASLSANELCLFFLIGLLMFFEF